MYNAVAEKSNQTFTSYSFKEEFIDKHLNTINLYQVITSYCLIIPHFIIVFLVCTSYC